MGTPLRILCVDDDPSCRKLVATVLQREGHEAILASTGANGLETLKADPTIDVLLTDKNLGDLSGLDLIAHARTLRPNLPIVLMTGAPERLTGTARPDAYLPKPFRTLASLITAVNDAVDTHKVNVLRKAAQEQLDGLRAQLSAT